MILDAATELFNAQGVRAVGVDTIAEESGVAKMTLYKYFPNKDLLIEACVSRVGERWREWMRSAIERLSPDPKGRPLAIFDAMEEWFCAPDFRGCAAINMTLELACRDHPATRAGFQHKRLSREYVVALCAGAGLPDAAAKADQLILLMEGAVVSAVIWGSPDPARKAKSAAKSLLGL